MPTTAKDAAARKMLAALKEAYFTVSVAAELAKEARDPVTASEREALKRKISIAIAAAQAAGIEEK